MKVGAQVTCHVKELEEQNSSVKYLKANIQVLEAVLQVTKDTHKHEIEYWMRRVMDLEKIHSEDLKKQIQMFCQIMYNNIDDSDMEAVQREIVEAAIAVKSDDRKEYEDLLTALLEAVMENKCKEIEKKQLATLQKRKRWNRMNDSKSLLQENAERQPKLNLLKDSELKMEELEDQQLAYLKKNSERLEEESGLNQIDNYTHVLRSRWEKYNNPMSSWNQIMEINELKCELECLSKEKASAEEKVKCLTNQIGDLKLSLQTQKHELLEEFKWEVSCISEEVTEKYEEKVRSDIAIKRERDILLNELKLNLEKEQEIDEKHREEILNLHKNLEVDLIREMSEVQVTQLQAEYPTDIAKESKIPLTQHRSELQKLQQRWNEEKLQLISLYEKEMKDLRSELEIEKEEVHTHLMRHRAQMKSFEDGYSRQKEEVQKLIREAKEIAAANFHAYSGSSGRMPHSSGNELANEGKVQCEPKIIDPFHSDLRNSRSKRH